MSLLMTKAAFSRLCQVSEPMMSPRKYGPYLVIVRGKVDARASLNALEGRLDTAKWIAAREKLDKLDAENANDPAPKLAVTTKTRGNENDDDDQTDDEPRGWKARGDMFKAKEAELSYHERVGALVDADNIGAATESVIADYCTEIERRVKVKASEYSSELKHDAAQATLLRTLMLKEDRAMRADFARILRAEVKRLLESVAAVA